jgi:acyl-CoA reductase-like NAD-dependent aldehyde dehydrogenase
MSLSDTLKPLVIENFIGGSFVKSSKYLDSFDPSTGEIWAQIPDSDPTDVDDAVQHARNAFPMCVIEIMYYLLCKFLQITINPNRWSKTTAAERAKILIKIADSIEENLDKLAQAESKDQGKPVSLAKRMDIPRAALNFRAFAESICHHVNM